MRQALAVEIESGKTEPIFQLSSGTMVTVGQVEYETRKSREFLLSKFSPDMEYRRINISLDQLAAYVAEYFMEETDGGRCFDNDHI